MVFPEPIFKLTDYYTYKNKYNNASINYSAAFDVTTDYNILPVQKTQGADVGYKYVVVEEVDKDNNKKGKTVYKFRSPIDYPNEATVIVQLQPIPIPNQDYLRGQLISEKKYDVNNSLLSETTTDYTSTAFEKNDGIKLKDNFINNMISELFQYNSYQDMVNHIGIGFALVSPYKNFEKFGITLPNQKIEKSYFYKNGVQSSISTTTNNVYNANDYPTSITQSFQDGNVNVTNYKYATEKANQKLINANMIGIPLELEYKKNNAIIKKEEIIYNDPLNYFPSSVISYDIQNNTTISEVKYEKYDAYGNLIQYKVREGDAVAIVWGYNNTQPIAKVEGITYDQLLATGLVFAIVSASDNDASNPSFESALITALDNFRNNTALSNYKITTYSYNPLVGVTSVTQPSGIREVYVYDSMNRLKEVRENDVNGSIIKEYNYNFKQ